MEIFRVQPSIGPDVSVDAFFEQLAQALRSCAADLAERTERALLAEERRAWETSLRELRRENEALIEELAEARRGKDIRRFISDPPPLPPLPGSPGGGYPTTAARGADAGAGYRSPVSQPSPFATAHEGFAAVGSEARVALPSAMRDSSSKKTCSALALTCRLECPPSPPSLPNKVNFYSEDEGHSASMPLSLPPVVLDTRQAPQQAWGDEIQGSSPVKRPSYSRGSPVRSEVSRRFMGKSDLADDFNTIPSGMTMKRTEPLAPEPALIVHEKLLRKQRLRLRNLLGLSANVRTVTVDMLRSYIVERFPGTRIEAAEISRILVAMQDAYYAQPRSIKSKSLADRAESSSYGRIDLRLLAEMLLHKDLLTYCDMAFREDVEWFCNALLTVTLEEVIDDATNSHGRMLDEDEKAKQRRSAGEICYSMLTGLVGAIVLLNITVLGVSIDNDPSKPMWLVIEIVCVAVFMLEVVVKVSKFGVKGYFNGEQRIWNVMDFSITVMSVVDVSISCYAMANEGTRGKGATRMVLILRAMRLARVVRLVKLLRTPIFDQLTNMLTGLFIGMPALFWVVILLLVVLFVLGLAFRLLFGPEEGQNMIALCGVADDLINVVDPPEECAGKLHWLYGEEFFGSVWLSMFTTFRFMLGDYSSRKGVSLAIVIGEGYGPAFHLLFGVGMILCVFGLFNIVTAIFVDSTISGLKHNDSMRKYAQQYEGRYVKAKLLQIVDRVGEVIKERSDGNRSRVSHASTKALLGRAKTSRFMRVTESQKPIRDMAKLEGLKLSNEDFCEVMDDPIVRVLLQDLDVEMYNPASFFETFDADDSGVVTVREIVQSLIRLRGEVRKNDLIASVVAVRALRGRVEQLTLALGAKAMVPALGNVAPDTAASTGDVAGITNLDASLEFCTKRSKSE